MWGFKTARVSAVGLAVGGVLCAVFAPSASLAQPAALIQSPLQLCRATARPSGAGAPALVAATNAAEALMAGADPAAADQALAVLDVPAAALAGADARTAAAYCSAAGEAARLGSSGSQPLAQTWLLAAIRDAEAADDAGLEARAAYRLGLASVTDSASGDVSGARGALKVDVAGEPALPDAAATDDACRDAVNRGASQGNQRLARAALGCAVARARAAETAELAALAGLRLARLDFVGAANSPLTARALRQEAQSAALAGLTDAKGVADPALRAELLGRNVEAALDAGVPDGPAIEDALASMASAAPDDPGAQAFAAALSGRLALARGDHAAATDALQRAVFLEGQRAQPFRLADWLLLLAAADPDRRQVHVMEAYRALESVRPLLPLVDPMTEESTFSLRMQPVFEAAVDYQLAGAAEDDPDRIAAAQQIIETYRQAELQSAFGVNCVAPSDPVKPTDLREGEILLYPVLLDDRIELIYAVRDNDGSAPRFERLPPNRSANRASVARLVADAVYSAGYGGDDAWREPAHTLYDLLIKPIETKLGPKTTLVVVPDGPLRALPFAMLTDDTGAFLIQKTRIAVAPALSYSQPGLDRGDHALTVVAGSLEKEVDLPAGDFPRLEGAAAEARAAFGEGDPGGGHGQLIADFSRAQLQQALSRGRVDVLHLATHADFNGRSDRSFIVANGEAIPMAQLREMIGRDRTRGDEIDLLVLSACQTAVGDDQASMGLAGAAVQAGAVSAIASLWEVSDTGTLELMKGFYGAYRGGESKAGALRDAQIALIAKGGDLAEPNVWAAFTLLGGWR